MPAWCAPVDEPKLNGSRSGARDPEGMHGPVPISHVARAVRVRPQANGRQAGPVARRTGAASAAPVWLAVEAEKAWRRRTA
jgi:hypothetical protein